MKKTFLILLAMVLITPKAQAQLFSDEGIGGAIIGGIAGGIIGHNNGRKTWEGALIGTGTGLLAGTILGQNQRSRGYSSRTSYPYRSRSYSSHQPHYSSHQPHYTQSYGTQHYCPQPRVVRQVVERPVYVQSNRGYSQPAYYPEPRHTYYPQPTVVVQQPVIIQQPTVFQTQPVIVSQPVIIQQPAYIPQITVVPQGGYRVTY